MKKIVLTGGSHTGKTTLLERLRQVMPPDVYFIPEPAELLISEELNKAEVSPGYHPLLPTTDYARFASLVVAKSLALESSIPPDTELVVMDRSLADNIAYARVNQHPQLVGPVARLARAANYSAALLCEFVGSYTPTAIRLEDRAYAEAIHAGLQVAYHEIDVPLFELPALTIESRMQLAMEMIDVVAGGQA